MKEMFHELKNMSQNLNLDEDLAGVSSGEWELPDMDADQWMQSFKNPGGKQKADPLAELLDRVDGILAQESQRIETQMIESGVFDLNETVLSEPTIKDNSALKALESGSGDKATGMNDAIKNRIERMKGLREQVNSQRRKKQTDELLKVTAQGDDNSKVLGMMFLMVALSTIILVLYCMRKKKKLKT